MLQAEQQAEDAGDTGAAGAQMDQGGVHGTHGAADGTADKGLEEAQVDAEDGRVR